MNQNQNKFYVYEHIKADTKEVFYVGKGIGNRCHKRTNRNRFWHNVVNKHGFEVKFVAKDLDEDLALLVEVERIDQLKKLNHRLCNLTGGGEGVSGLVMSAESRKKMSDSHIGKKPSQETRKKQSLARVGVKKSEEHKLKIGLGNKGKVRSLETKQKISDLKSKKVICLETNTVYQNAYEASKQTKIQRSGISRCCRGDRKTAGKLTWRYTE